MTDNVRITTYDDGGRAVASWPDLADVSFSTSLYGPETATVAHPAMVNGVPNPALHHTRLLSGGRGVRVEIDASSLGAPVFLGRAVSLPQGSNSPTIGVSVAGPHSWLDRIPVPAQGAYDAPAGRVVEDVLGGLGGVDARIDLGVMHHGTPVPVELGGGSLWQLFGELQDLTNERPHMTATPGACRLVLDWLDVGAQLESPVIATLEEGVNCEWDADADLDPPLEQLVVTGWSVNSGTESRTAGVRAPGGPVLGKRAALSAALATGVSQVAFGASDERARPDLAALPALQAAAQAALQRGLTPPMLTNIRVTDEALWHKLRCGRLVRTVFPSDVLGVWRRGIGEIQQATWGIRPARSLDIAVELWSVEA